MRMCGDYALRRRINWFPECLPWLVFILCAISTLVLCNDVGDRENCGTPFQRECFQNTTFPTIQKQLKQLSDSPSGRWPSTIETKPHLVQLPIGGSVNITCRMNKSHFNESNSACLRFYNGKEPIPDEHIHIIDDTSIVYMITNASEQSSRYICKCNTYGVDITEVEVGTPPTEVTDFQCRTYDFSYMTCNFTAPENKIYTQYNLTFKASTDNIQICDLPKNNQLGPELTCNITKENAKYDYLAQNYTFNLTAYNALDTLTQFIPIDHFRSMVPAKPDVEIRNITTNSVSLVWKVINYTYYRYTKGLNYEIRLKPDGFDWIDINTSSLWNNHKNGYFSVEISDLTYAYHVYTVQVRARTVKAGNDDTMWSDKFEGKFKTSARRPDAPPKVDIGSFHIDPIDNIIQIYWKQLPEYEENGPDFRYNVTAIKQTGNVATHISAIYIDNTSAKFQYQNLYYYEFSIVSQNRLGQSNNASILRVAPNPKRSLQLEKQKITKVYHRHSYTITWRQPDDIENLDNFTLFWCVSETETKSQCKGTIEFKHFDKHIDNYTMEPRNDTSLNFALSANYRTYVTGMIWVMCTPTKLIKIQPETEAQSARTIRVHWNSDCPYDGILEGYNLSYCKVGSNKTDIVGNCTNVNINKRETEYIIVNLEPDTEYEILISMYSKTKMGPKGEPVYQRTAEDVPTPPRDLQVSHVTRTSAVISWLPPELSNGVLKYYTIWGIKNQRYVNASETDGRIAFELNDLLSFHTYVINITAHNSLMSEPSNIVEFKTHVGVPSMPRTITVTKNDNGLVLQWSDPEISSGCIEFYEVSIKDQKSNNTRVCRVEEKTCRITHFPCTDENTYFLYVQAVNVAEKNMTNYHTCKNNQNVSYTNPHYGAIKRRRHSNAEISMSVSGSYLIHDTTEKHISHRHERENLKLTQGEIYTTHRTVIDNENLDTNIDSLKCIDESAKFAHYDDPHKYDLFRSKRANINYVYACRSQSPMVIMIAILLLFSTIGFTSVFVVYKKINKMRNIGLVIPEGLEDDLHPKKIVENQISREEISRSDELLLPKEDHRLIAKIGNDTGFLNNVQCPDKTSVCSDHQDSEKTSQSTDSVELNDITSSYTSSPSYIVTVHAADVPVPEEERPVNTAAAEIQTARNGYIKPTKFTSGYVPAQNFENMQAMGPVQTRQAISTREAPVSFASGYTTLDALGKPMVPAEATGLTLNSSQGSCTGDADSKSNSNKSSGSSQPLTGTICGYVTHKQLSNFGQVCSKPV